MGKDWLARAAYERKVMAQCDRVIALSEADARRLARLSSRSKISIIPTGVDLEKFSFRDGEGRNADRLLYVGHYPHYPNEDAAVFLAREVLPKVLARRPGAKLSLVGSIPTPAVKGLASRQIDVVGTVPDVVPHLQTAGVFLAPIRLGRGIKGKILEAFSAGLPVVATSLACEAMPGLRDGEHLLVADSPQELADKTLRLMNDPELREKLARAARAYVEARFGWADKADRLDALYREVLRAAPVTA